MNDLLMAWTLEREPWPIIAPAGGGITAAGVVKYQLLPTLKSSFRVWPGDKRPLSNETVERVENLLAELGPLIEEQLLLARFALDDGVRQATAANVRLNKADLAVKLLSRLGNLNSQGHPHTEDKITVVASTFVRNRLERAKPLISRKRFAQFADHFDQRWDETGAPNMEKYSYFKANLGDDVRPPLVVAGRESEDLGLGRSVYWRYMAAFNDLDVHGDTEQIAHAEMERACGRLGLLEEAPLVVLRSISTGLSTGPSEPGDKWYSLWESIPEDPDWKHRLGNIQPEGGNWEQGSEMTNYSFAGYVRANYAFFLYRTDPGRGIYATARTEEAACYAMRRAWQRCFEFDRRNHELTPLDAATIARNAIYLGMGHMPRFRFVNAGAGAGNVMESVAAPVSPEKESRDFATRQQVTYSWMADNDGVWSGLVSGDADIMRTYSEAAETLGLLSLEEVTRYLRDLMNRSDGDNNE